MKRLRALSIVLLAIPALALVSQAYAAAKAAEAPAWRRYQPPDGRISTALPAKPRVTKTPEGYHMLATPDEHDAFIVAYRRLDGAGEDRSGQVFAAVIKMFRKKGYTVLGQRRVRVAGHPGQEVHIKTQVGFYGWDRMFLVGDGFYQMLLMTDLNRPAPTRFWQSMVLNR